MRVLLKDKLIVLLAETAEESTDLARWKSDHGEHVFLVRADAGPKRDAVELRDLGGRLEACRVPINVISSSSDPLAQVISNLAATPFELDGRRYRSVESFWQGLKFESDEDRSRIADFDGPQARREGTRQGYGDAVAYEGARITVGTSEHWRLMERACWSKFTQSEEARSALLATGERPLVHITRRDSKAIPGAIMAEIWMRIRRRLRTPDPRSQDRNAPQVR